MSATETAAGQYSPNGPEMENLYIGSGQDDGNNFFFSGNVDDVTIWDTALDSAAINDIRLNSIPEPSIFGLISLAGLGMIHNKKHIGAVFILQASCQKHRLLPCPRFSRLPVRQKTFAGPSPQMCIK